MSWYPARPFLPSPTNNLPLRAIPVPFAPVDISGLALWLDAADESTVEINLDTSGVNVNRVMKWFDKAFPDNNNYFHHHGAPDTSGLYNQHYMVRKPTVYFEPYAMMSHRGGGIVFPFQARTFFCVIKPLTDLSDAALPFNNIFWGADSGAMQTGFSYNSAVGLYNYTMCEAGFSCGIIFDLSNNPVKQRQIIMFAQTDQVDLSGNTGAFDTLYKPLSESDPADNYDTTTLLQYYLNDGSKPTAQDIAEILLYDHLLTRGEQEQVMDYLAAKWNDSGTPK